jgi:AhpD family alkylhydroperoxidase
MSPAPRAEYAALRTWMPEAEKGLVALGRAARMPELSPALLELVDLRASQINGCAYCLQLHTNKAVKAGVDSARLAQLAAWRESPVFSMRERAALAWTEALTTPAAHGVPDAVYAAARQELGDAGLAALTAKVLAINAWNRLMVAYRIAPPDAEPAAVQEKSA